eukprot:scaffold3859_cov122-Isochrysis_galbana.AAC.2
MAPNAIPHLSTCDFVLRDMRPQPLLSTAATHVRSRHRIRTTHDIGGQMAGQSLGPSVRDGVGGAARP